MYEKIEELKNRIYDLKDEMDTNQAVLDDKLDNLESKVSEINEMLKQLLFEKDHSI